MKKLLTGALGLMLVGPALINFAATRQPEKPESLPTRNQVQKNPSRQVFVKTTPDGELTDASYVSGNRTIRASVRKEKTAEGTRGSILFSQNGESFLLVTADIIRKPTDTSLVRADLKVSGSGVDYSIAVDVTEANPDRASVQISNGRRVWKGAFDFKQWQYLGPSDAPRVDVLPSEVKTKIAPFAPALKGLVEFYQRESTGWFATTPGQPPPHGDTGVSEFSWGGLWKKIKGPLCRGGCWGLGGAIAAAGCITTGIETAGVGCVVSGGAAGAGASLCSDACPK